MRSFVSYCLVVGGDTERLQRTSRMKFNGTGRGQEGIRYGWIDRLVIYCLADAGCRNIEEEGG